MKVAIMAVALCLLLALSALAPAASHGPVLDWAALLPEDGRRPVHIEDVQNAEGLPGLRAIFAVRAGRDNIWRTLVDYDNFPRFFPQITKMVVLDEDENGALIKFWGDAVLMELHYTLKRTYVELGHKLTWVRVSGDMKHIEGSWRIIEGPQPPWHAMIYESFVDTGFPIIGWFVRQGAKQEARRMAEAITAWIEAQAGVPN
jgi:hypothetical protein